MTRNAKASLILVAAVVVGVAAVLLLSRLFAPSPATDAASGSGVDLSDGVLVRPESHRLSEAPDGKVTVVEFLDLECEACLAAFPAVEQLRAEYADQVTFVMRYFPIPSHVNAELAARAVEAAAQQGQLEPMYQLMYETQAEWGDQQVSHRQTFVGFAEQLGLDVPAFIAAIDDPATIARVLVDRDDGLALGVRGTPTFFINGSTLEGPPTYEALRAAIDTELAR